MEEIEGKFLEINIAELRKKLKANNAKKIHNVDIVHAPTIIERHNQNISFFYLRTRLFLIFNTQ